MTSRCRSRSFLAVAAVALALLALSAFAAEVPDQLPDPDGKPGDASKPVKVYIPAGQSNMVGMGNLSGARCRYTRIYLTADPAAPKGPMDIYPVGHYKCASHGVYVSADRKADHGATASIYAGAYDTATDYDKAKPAKTETVAPGVAHGTLPAVDGSHTVVVRGFIDVPESGNYTVGAGYGDSSYNVTGLDGKEVYRKEFGGHIYNDFRDEFKGGKVTIAAMSFLRYNHPRINPYPPAATLRCGWRSRRFRRWKRQWPVISPVCRSGRVQRAEPRGLAVALVRDEKTSEVERSGLDK